MKYILHTLTILLLSSLVSIELQSQTTITLEPVKDNSIFQVPNRYSNGAGPEIFTGTVNNGTALARRGLIQFSFADIPAGATITDAELELYCTKASSSGNQSDFDLHRLEESWGEEDSFSPNGQGVLADIGDATWKDRFYDPSDGEEWEQQGGTVVSIPSASTPVNVKNAYYIWTSDQLVEDVQDMLDNPNDNYGWILKATDEDIGGLGRAFGSRENEDMQKRPKLSVTYDVTTSVDGMIEANEIRVFPNPGQNVLTIETAEAITDQNYQIADLQGRIIMEGVLSTPTTRISATIVQPGYYFISFPGSDIKTITWVKN